MSKRIVLIGAGSAMFGLSTLGDIFQCEALAGSTLVLFDIDEEALRKVEATTRGFIATENLPFQLIATTSRKEALSNADFCIISI
ncbi:MAG: hypothetical protein AAGU75_17550, partial [Bacillota bacterium]